MKTHYRKKGEPLDGGDLHECMVCQKVIRNASNFKKHMKIHTGLCCLCRTEAGTFYLSK